MAEKGSMHDGGKGQAEQRQTDILAALQRLRDCTFYGHVWTPPGVLTPSGELDIKVILTSDSNGQLIGKWGSCDQSESQYQRLEGNLYADGRLKIKFPGNPFFEGRSLDGKVDLNAPFKNWKVEGKGKVPGKGTQYLCKWTLNEDVSKQRNACGKKAQKKGDKVAKVVPTPTRAGPKTYAPNQEAKLLAILGKTEVDSNAEAKLLAILSPFEVTEYNKSKEVEQWPDANMYAMAYEMQRDEELKPIEEQGYFPKIVEEEEALCGMIARLDPEMDEASIAGVKESMRQRLQS